MSFRNIQVVLSGNTTPLQASLRSASAQLDQFAHRTNRNMLGLERTASLAQKGIVAGVVTITAAVVASTTMAAQFERDMRNVNTLTKLQDAQFKQLGQTVIDMSKRSTQSADTLAKGLYDIASSGFQGAAGVRVLDESQKAASAGMTDTATAAQAITAVLNAYGRGAQDAGDVSDVLFKTVDQGVITFETLSNQLGDVVGIAAAAGIQIDDVGSAIAAMTLSGISGAESTTSLNRVIQGLIQPSDNLSKLLKSMGYESGQAAISALGLHGVMEKLREETGGTAEAYLKLFPDIRGARGAFALAAADGKNYAKTQSAISDETKRAGAAQAAYNEQMKAVSNQIEVAKNKLAAFSIEAGSHVLPVVSDLVAGSIELGGALGHGLREGADLVAPLFHELVSIGGDLFEIFGTLTSALGPLVGLLVAVAATGVVEVLTKMAQATAALTGLIADHKALTLGLAAGLAVLLIPLSAVTFMFNKWILTPIVLAISNIIGAVGTLTGAFTGLAVAEAAATFGISAIVAIGVGLGVHFWGQAKKAEKQARDTAKAIAEIYDPKNAKSVQDVGRQMVDATRALKAEQQKIIDNLAKKDISKDLLDEPDYLRHVSREYKALDDEIGRVTDDYVKLNSTLIQAGNILGLNRDQVYRLAQKYGVDLSQSAQKVAQDIKDFAGDSLSGATSSTQKLKAATDELASGVSNADDKLQALKDTFDALIGVNLNADEAFDRMQGKLDDLAQSFLDNGRSMDAFTESGRANKQALRDTIAAIEDHITALQEQGATGPELQAAFDAEYNGLVDTMRAAGYTDEAIRTLLASYGLVPTDIETRVKAAGADEAAAAIDGVTAAMKNIPSLVIGNVKIQFDENGGMFPWKVVPNTTVTAQTNKTTPTVRAGRGTVRTGDASQSGGSNDREKKQRDAKRDAEEAARKREEEQDRKDEAAARRRQQARDTKLAARTAIFDPSQIYSDLVARREAQARAVAQAKADNSKNKYDTADDYFKKPQVTLKDYQKELTAQVKTQRQWKKDLAKIAKEAGQDVADQLEAMGESGVDLVTKMANGTKKQVQEMAKTLRSLGPTAKEAMQDFAAALHLDVAKQAAFQANLIKLIQTGHADLAATLAAGGVEQYGDIAAAAVKATPAELAGIEKDLATQNNLASGQDLTDLALMISKIAKDVGVIGLSRLTGLSAQRELELYQKYMSAFESGAKGKLDAWHADIAAINAGKQPRAYAAGTIIPQGRTGEFYRWAEPESGGESLIPHGMAHRGRALALWAETGRILGVVGANGPQKASFGGSGGGVVVQDGAVTVRVDVASTNATPAQIQTAVQSGVKNAMGELAQLLAAGTGRNN